MIRAGTLEEVTRHSGEWVFVDVGFAEKAESCGLLIGDGKAVNLTFAKLGRRLAELALAADTPMNLLIEAPLSVAFDEHGNPTGRSIERRGAATRYWYVGLGCSVMVAATYLLRATHDAAPIRDIRLFEGFASFKPKGQLSDHQEDVRRLRGIVWKDGSAEGQVIPPQQLARAPGHTLQSAFAVAGMDFGIPPVVMLG